MAYTSWVLDCQALTPGQLKRKKGKAASVDANHVMAAVTQFLQMMLPAVHAVSKVRLYTSEQGTRSLSVQHVLYSVCFEASKAFDDRCLPWRGPCWAVAENRSACDFYL